tara:strand:+ start:479 stop:1696 length:1218 start_codon:yes stop_codon:yes gene_type:complete
MPVKYRKNLMLGDNFKLAQNNDRDYFEYIHNRHLDSNEASSLSDSDRQFKAICLTGDTGDEINYNHDLVAFGDGTTRWAIRFKAKDKFGSKTKFTDILGNPLVGTNADKMWNITSYPVAYSETSYDKVTFRYGADIIIKELADGTFIARPDMQMSVSIETQEEYSSPPPKKKTLFNKMAEQGKKLLSALIGTSRSRQPVSNIMNSLSTGDKILIFGDSQATYGSTTGGDAMGKVITTYFQSKNFKVLGGKPVYKHSQEPSYYIKNFNRIKKHLQDKDLKIILIFLGGNGPTGAANLMKKINQTITNKDVKIIWHGAPPPAFDGVDYPYKKHYERRKKFNETLESEIGSTVNAFINPYKLTGFETGYQCKGNVKKCDGIHVPGPIAIRMMMESGLIDANYSPNGAQ